MSVIVRPYRRGGWEVGVRVRLPNGRERRARKKARVTSKTAAIRWGEQLERELLVSAPSQLKKEVPTLSEFAPRFIEGYARANRQKPSGIAGKETILRVHLVPRFGARKLDAIANEDVQRLKSALGTKAPKTVNNVLTVLNTLLRTAVDWNLIERVPCAIRLLPTPEYSAGFHDFEEFERLVVAAKGIDSRTTLIVLLGGEAGLRCGEMMALEWRDIDLTRGRMVVERSDWKGQITATKGGRVRYVPLTKRLAATFKGYRHLRGARVLCDGDGTPLSQKIVQCAVRRAALKAHLRNTGVHVLRHTFCSHLSMRGAPARAIQELAGHKDLATTQRYMHLSPAATDGAICLLDDPRGSEIFGDIGETGSTEIAKSSR
jgi:integrase